MSLLGLLAKTGKNVATGAKTLVKSKVEEAFKPVKDLKTVLSGGTVDKTSEGNVGLSQLLGGAQQAANSQIDMTPLNSLKSFMSNMDTGFYKHTKVKGMKQDKSKWSKL